MRYPGVRLMQMATEEHESAYEPIIIDMSESPPKIIAILVMCPTMQEAMTEAVEMLAKLESYEDALKKGLEEELKK